MKCTVIAEGSNMEVGKDVQKAVRRLVMARRNEAWSVYTKTLLLKYNDG